MKIPEHIQSSLLKLKKLELKIEPQNDSVEYNEQYTNQLYDVIRKIQEWTAQPDHCNRVWCDVILRPYNLYYTVPSPVRKIHSKEQSKDEQERILNSAISNVKQAVSTLEQVNLDVRLGTY